jgi:hypothetical protein
MRARWQTTPVRLCSVNRRQGRSWTVSGDGTTSVSRSQAGESSATLLECLPRRSRVTRFAPSGKPGNAQRAYGNRLRPQKVSYVASLNLRRKANVLEIVTRNDIGRGFSRN